MKAVGNIPIATGGSPTSLQWLWNTPSPQTWETVKAPVFPKQIASLKAWRHEEKSKKQKENETNIVFFIVDVSVFILSKEEMSVKIR